MPRKGQIQQIIADLADGKTVRLKCHGNSMTPRIPNKSTVVLEPVTLVDVEVGDEVMCKVRGNIYEAHLVTAIRGGPDNRQVQISNNHGHVNGWTKAVFGRVTRVEAP